MLSASHPGLLALYSCGILCARPAQIWENYQLQSGEGLSVAFVVLWLVGDLTNLAGGAMAHLLPTMVSGAREVRGGRANGRKGQGERRM